jgi:hypothetical protein
MLQSGQFKGINERPIGASIKRGEKNVDLNIPVYTRKSRRHIFFETLNTYRIDYELDRVRAIPKKTRGY